jgi:hypothetical protein
MPDYPPMLIIAERESVDIALISDLRRKLKTKKKENKYLKRY